jgi:hypothetical protein
MGCLNDPVGVFEKLFERETLVLVFGVFVRKTIHVSHKNILFIIFFSFAFDSPLYNYKILYLLLFSAHMGWKIARTQNV